MEIRVDEIPHGSFCSTGEVHANKALQSKSTVQLN